MSVDAELRAAARAVEGARADLRGQLAAARAELDAMRSRPLFTEQERRELQETAQRGEMGPEMREFSEEVRRGNADWESFVRRQDGRQDLLERFAQQAEDEHAEEAAEAFAQSPIPEDVEDDPRLPGGGATAR